MGEAKNHVWYDGYYKTHQDIGGEYVKKPEKTYYWPVWEIALKWIGKARVVDLGCGPGQFGLACMRKGIQYNGYDFSPQAIEMAGKMTGHPECFKVADITKNMGVGYDKHKVVVTLETLEHINDDMAILRALPQGIRVIFSVPNFDYKSHVRFFKSRVEVKNRYKSLIRIKQIRSIKIGEKHIFLVEGNRI